VRVKGRHCPTGGLLLAATLLLPACSPAVASLGHSPEEGADRVTELVDSLVACFGPFDLDPKLKDLRPRLAQAALAPSRIYPDATAWTRTEGPVKTLELKGTPGATPWFGVAAGAPVPDAPGAYRDVITLRPLASGEYGWGVRAELALGRASGADLDRALGTILSLAESVPPGDGGGAVRAALPRSAQSLGRVLHLDALALAREPGGPTVVEASVSIHSEGLQKEYPRFAKYLHGLTPTLRIRFDVADEAGLWWQVTMRHDRVGLRCRVWKGELIPLEGPRREMPAGLKVGADYTVKIGLFRVGLTNLEGHVTRKNAPERRAFEFVFQKEPQWSIPFLVQPFMKSSLRRPFEGDGMTYALSLEEGPGGQTRFVEEYFLAVHESWVVRWFGGNVADTVIDYENGAEQESGRFCREVLLALKEDLLTP
jgi:hypothetical protein